MCGLLAPTVTVARTPQLSIAQPVRGTSAAEACAP